MDRKANIFVSTAPEISNLLDEEIKALGFANTTVHPLGVQLYGSMADCMYLNLHLRTANKVLWEAGRFRASTPEHLYQKAFQIHWEDEIKLDGYFNIDSYVREETITDTRFANLKLKDAIVDRFAKSKRRRPNTGPEKDKARIFMHWTNQECILYYDTSGAPISKHGYRKMPGRAPMLESLAAATILTSKWDQKSPFVNPMCGSGTLAIEAALIASKTPPGIFRSNFGFMHLKSFDLITWDRMVENAKKKIVPVTAQIIASDIASMAIETAKANAQFAGMDKYIQFEKCDFRDTPLPEGHGVVFLNPEYGERLGDIEQLSTTYKQIGDWFKQKCQGYNGYIFTGNRDLGKQIGLRTRRKIPFYNASIECRLLEYELYSGSKKPQ